MNTGVPGRAPEGTRRVQDMPWYQWIQTDESRATLANLGSTILSVLKRIGFERTDHVDETWVRAYAAPFPTTADCKGALAFPAHIGKDTTAAVLIEHAANLPVLAAKPAMYVHGEAGPRHPDRVLGRRVQVLSGPPVPSSHCPALDTSSRKTPPRRPAPSSSSSSR